MNEVEKARALEELAALHRAAGRSPPDVRGEYRAAKQAARLGNLHEGARLRRQAAGVCRQLAFVDGPPSQKALHMSAKKAGTDSRALARARARARARAQAQAHAQAQE